MHIGERDNSDSVLKIAGGEDACWGVYQQSLSQVPGGSDSLF